MIIHLHIFSVVELQLFQSAIEFYTTVRLLIVPFCL